MIQHKIGDLFQSDADVIVHQVNCRGVMGSGVAKQVKKYFPDTFMAYSNMCKRYAAAGSTEELLGQALFVIEGVGGHEVGIANLFSQFDYGYDKKLYTNYNAFREALQDMKTQLLLFCHRLTRDPRIAIPYRIGCDRGGGDWDTVYKIIEEELSDFDVTLYELPKN